MTTSQFNTIQYRIENHTAHCTLNRPQKRNAINPEMIQELQHALTDAAKNPDVRVVILNAAGKAFSAGADLNWMQQSINFSAEENYQDAWQLAQCLKTLYECPLPTIALVQGDCYGGANGLVAACDFALAAKGARFCFPEVKLGLVPAVISPYILQCMGQRITRQYFLSAQPFTATQALEYHLITAIAADLETAGQHLAETLCTNQPQALQHCKTLLKTVDTSPERLAATAQLIATLRTGEEAQHALTTLLGL
jgi:methylglutaconyl-CoA hydratase